MKPMKRKRQKPEKSIGKTRKKIAFKKNRILFLAALAALLIVLVSGIRYIGSFQALQNKESWAAALREAPTEQGVNYLLVGLTGEQKKSGVEEMLFLNYPEPDAQPHIIFIPGNLLIQRQEGNAESFYTPTLLYNQGDMELLIDHLMRLLMTDIHHYVKVHYEGIAELVDDRGGIPYRGYTLTGADFLESFLHEEEGEAPHHRALGRAGTIRSLLEFLDEKSGAFGTPAMLREAAPFVETDLDWKEMQAFYDKYSGAFESESMVLNLPGKWREINGEPFYEPDLVQLAMMMENLGSDFMIPREMITVEVLNGSGVSGIAGRTGEYLREEGFQVVNIDNADHQDYQRSHVISRIDDIEAAREVALLIPGAEFFKEPLPNYPAMVTVIVGKNFDL